MSLFGLFGGDKTNTNTTNNNYDQRQVNDASNNGALASGSNNTVNSTGAIEKQAALAATVSQSGFDYSAGVVSKSTDLLSSVFSLAQKQVSSAEDTSRSVVQDAQTAASKMLDQAQNPGADSTQKQLLLVVIGVVLTALFSQGKAA